MSDQMPIVFLPSGISRIIPSTLDSKDDRLTGTFYHRGFPATNDKGARKEKLTEKSPGDGASSDTGMADESGEFLPEMSVDDDDEDDRVSDDTVHQKNKETSPTPSSTAAGANPKTLKVYQSHVRVFKDWLKSESLPTDFEYCSTEELSSWLKKFYRDGKRKDGQQWKPSSLKIFRFAINQHLNNEPFSRSISITRDQQFKEANSVISERHKELVQLGEDATGTRESKESARPLTTEDVRQLFQRGIVGVSSPKALHRYVFMILGINFGITTRLALHLLRPSMLQFKVDDNSGLMYVQYDPKKDKTTSYKIQNKPKRKMYGLPGNPMCPITALKLYIQKRNPECTEAFFHTPNRHYKETGVWYTPQATGKNTLGRLMKDIAAEGKLSFPYTNHSLRYTPPYIFTPPDPHQSGTTYGISGDKIAALNGTGKNDKLFLNDTTSTYNLLNIRPKVTGESQNNSVLSSGIPYRTIVDRPSVTSTTSETHRIPLLYPPVYRSTIHPSPSEGSSEGAVGVSDNSTKASCSPRMVQLANESRPKHYVPTTKPIKAHNVLCVPQQWEIQDILRALNAGEAIILSKQSVLESTKQATITTNGVNKSEHTQEQQGFEDNPSTDTLTAEIKKEDLQYDLSASNLLKTASQKLSSTRPGRKQPEPKRIRPDEFERDNSFQVEVAYDDAVTSIQANITLIRQLQKTYPPTKQTIDELVKIRRSLDRLLAEI